MPDVSGESHAGSDKRSPADAKTGSFVQHSRPGWDDRGKSLSREVLEARKAIVEFLLINHPLDCPVCDQAGNAICRT